MSRRAATCSDARWDAYVCTHRAATVYHQAAWPRLLARVFRRRPANAGGDSGRPRHRRACRWSASAAACSAPSPCRCPFVNYGGVLADDVASERALLDAAIGVARAWGALAPRAAPHRTDFAALLAEASQGRHDDARCEANRRRAVAGARPQAAQPGAQSGEERPDGHDRRRRRCGRLLRRLQPQHARPRHAGLPEAILRRDARRVSRTGARVHGHASRSAGGRGGRRTVIGDTFEVPSASSLREFRSSARTCSSTGRWCGSPSRPG